MLLLTGGALIVACLAPLRWRGERDLWRQPVVLAFGALLAMLAAATVLGRAPSEALFGAYNRRHGLMAWLALGVLFIEASRLARDPSARDRLLLASVLGSVGPSAYALVQFVGADPVRWDISVTRAASTLGNPLPHRNPGQRHLLRQDHERAGLPRRAVPEHLVCDQLQRHVGVGRHADAVRERRRRELIALVQPTAPSPPATDVTSTLSVTQGPFFWVPNTDRFVQPVWVANASGATVQGPISFVLDGLTGNTTVIGAEGRTTCTSGNSQYLDVYLGASGLAHGEWRFFLMEVTASPLVPPTYTPRVLAGPGCR